MAEVWSVLNPATNSDLVSADIRSQWRAIQASLQNGNLVRDAGFLIWPGGDAATPGLYTRTGVTGSAIARDTVERYASPMNAKVTGGSAAVEVLKQVLIPAATFPTVLRGLEFSIGGAVYPSSGGVSRIGLYDGVSVSWSSYAAGAGSWQWLTATRTLAAGATELTLYAEVGVATDARFSDLTVVAGPIAPPYPIASRVSRFLASQTIPGTLAAATTVNGWRYPFPLPCIIRSLALSAVTAGSGASATFDAKKGGTTMFTTKPELAAGQTYALASVADADRRYASFAVGDQLTLDCISAGGTPPSDVTLALEGFCFQSPWAFLGGF